MARSMTGYGRAEAIIDNFEISVELKSVNHKYFDFSVHLPRGFAFLEDKLKAHTNSRVFRGKTEMFVSVRNKNEDSVSIEINKEFCDVYYKALCELRDSYSLFDDISVMGFANNSDVFTVKKSEVDEEKITSDVITVLDLAIDKFIQMRKTEGKRLTDDILEKADNILKKVEFVEERSPETVNQYSERLYEKIKETLNNNDVDEQRVLTEVALFADKVAVDEETVRLRSHISQLKSLIVTDEPVGRKLDFIVQEMNREVNTTGSKAQDLDIINTVVDMKSEIEKIREQIQNLE